MALFVANRNKQRNAFPLGLIVVISSMRALEVTSFCEWS